MNLRTNSAGRPTNNKIIKFSHQPRSIISQFLIDERQKVIKKDEPEANIANEKPNIKNSRQSLEKNIKFCQSTRSGFHVEGRRNIIDLDESLTKIVDDKLIRKCSSSGPLTNKISQKLPQLLKTKDNSEVNENLLLNKPMKNENKKKVVEGVKLFVCSYPTCTYYTKISSNLSKHKRTHSCNKLYLCDQCTFSTKFSNSLNVHKRLHTNEKPFICQHCDYRCNSSSNLKKHISHRH